ncbi:transcriptional regulator [Lactobacillus sp. CBA3606]|uniref:winged helix-turn-helix transcriptional regulator n=1 Tax=Lactobacillus sp. CBA3606 TaxID=2099789 RepID=UPI000CFD16D6|nr:helix-turn-helix domain-containing protein [Lactobacillus sp. CBA3606]AVK63512.1 transcriptional regulator [Lactobacillus sp. CBA3606]
MKRYTYNCEQGCPVDSTLQVISGKWKAVLLYYLFENKKCRFGDFQRFLPRLSARMLALQLNELEQDNIIAKKVFPVMPPKTEYKLTKFGQTLQPLIDEMVRWGEYYNTVHSEQTEG